MRALAADQNPVNAHGSAPIDSGVRLPHGRYPRRLVSRALTALGELGIDSRQVLDRWMQASVGDGGGDRAVHAFWAAAAGVSGQAGVGIRLAERVPADDFGLLGQLVSNSATLGEALLHGLRLSRLSSGAAQLSVHLDGERTCIAVEGAGARSLHREEVEFVLACGILAARALTGVDISPIEVSFAHDAPQDLTHHQRVFRAPLRFGALQSACTIPTRTLLAPLAHGDSRLRAVLLDEAEKWMERHSVELPQRVRAAILAELRHGDPSIKRVSARVGTYPRMLTRKLGALGLNYREFLARTRFELAEQHLRRPETRITTIADTLGYSDKSAFIRAFKRHAGCSPLEYRQRARRNQSESPPTDVPQGHA